MLRVKVRFGLFDQEKGNLIGVGLEKKQFGRHEREGCCSRVPASAVVSGRVEDSDTTPVFQEAGRMIPSRQGLKWRSADRRKKTDPRICRIDGFLYALNCRITLDSQVGLLHCVSERRGTARCCRVGLLCHRG